MNSTGRFQVFGPEITHGRLDGDVVLVNVRNGRSYSMYGVGAAIWTLLVAGQSVEAIFERCARCLGVTVTRAASVIEPFIAALEAEELIRPAPSDAPRGVVADDVFDGVAPPLVAPLFRQFTDLEELLLLEPIWNDAPSGWANQT
jgi:Coenzyme PQQ synthesis protein D (PqqD)